MLIHCVVQEIELAYTIARWMCDQSRSKRVVPERGIAQMKIGNSDRDASELSNSKQFLLTSIILKLTSLSNS